MFETARKYSESTYYNKTDLEKEMDYYLVDPLWHEIEQYRSLFRQEFPLQGKKTYLIRNPLVNDTMAITQEWLLAWLMKHQESSDVDIDLFWLKEAERERFTRLLVKMRYDKEMNPRLLFQEVFDHFIVDRNLELALRSYLEEETNNLLLKLFRLGMECDKRTAFLLYFPTLYLHHCFPLSAFVTMEELMDRLDHHIINMDVTSNFLTLLEVLRLKFSDEMLSLNRKDAISLQKLDARELMERYPMLQKESIAFYVAHRKLHHYYTLQDYMQNAGVCYETARYSMEKLVALKWYQKQKIGKKFVYFVL